MSGKTYRVGFVGCGRIARLHAIGYKNHPNCQVIALTDIKREVAEEFAKTQGFERASIYTDYRDMLEKEELDIVSICLWPQLHLSVARDCAKAGIPAVHCEKPIAPTWGEALDLAEAFKNSSSQLTFNHQRRFRPSFRKAKSILESQELGLIERMEVYIHAHLLDMGTHLIDLMFMMNKENPVKWVIGQIDAREVRQWFNIPYEFAAFAALRFENNVRATIHCGDDHTNSIYIGLRVMCSEGILEARFEEDLRVLKYGEGKWYSPLSEQDKDPNNILVMKGVVDDIISGLEGKKVPELSVTNAMQATEVIFAIYESSRRRARIDLPLEARDSAFISMLASGEIGIS